MASSYRIYWSRRPAPLVFTGDEGAGEGRDVPVLTVENFAKWYGLYLVHPDGRVEEIDFGVLEDAARKLGVSPYVDHVPRPEVVEATASARGWILDEASREVIVGRWRLEVKGN